jgi:hypothetical protein
MARGLSLKCLKCLESRGSRESAGRRWGVAQGVYVVPYAPLFFRLFFFIFLLFVSLLLFSDSCNVANGIEAMRNGGRLLANEEVPCSTDHDA